MLISAVHKPCPVALAFEAWVEDIKNLKLEISDTPRTIYELRRFNPSSKTEIKTLAGQIFELQRLTRVVKMFLLYLR